MFKRSLFSVLFVISLTGSAFAVASKDEESWETRMRAMAASISELMPYISSSTKFNDPASQPKIQLSVDSLASLAKDLKGSLQKHGKTSSKHASDPIFPFMAAAFEDDISNAQFVLKSGDRKYAQHLLQNSLSYCTSCHVRGENKSEFKFPMFADQSSDLNVFEQMKLLTASRQFDKAIDIFNTHLNSDKLKTTNPLEIEQAARLALAISVRLNKNLDDAVAQAEKVKTIDKVSLAFKEELSGWITGLKDLKKVPKLNSKEEKALFNRAKALVERAQGKQKSLTDRSAEIDYLRATALLHDLVETYPRSKKIGEALYLLGTSYSTLQQLGFWSLHEAYFEACVRKTPHSELAGKCFNDLKESVTFGYTGSSGTNVPPGVQRKLSDLKALAAVKGK